MKRGHLLNPRNPFWPWMGRGLGLTTLAVTGFMLAHRTDAVPAGSATDPIKGRGRMRHGTLKEQLGKGTFVLAFDEGGGDEASQELHGVTGTLSEAEAQWTMLAPSARRTPATVVLTGPLQVTARTPDLHTVLGQGKSETDGDALQWHEGTWRGLAPLAWEDLAGQARGLWNLPAGWSRDLAGRFHVERGPVRWQAYGPGALRALRAQRMEASLGMGDGRVEDVEADLEGGQVKAGAMVLAAGSYHWEAPITFRREDGWRGEATSGFAPRPPEGKTLDRVEWTGFKAFRAQNGGQESLDAQGARWTPAGLRLEGDVRWSSPLGQDRQPGDPDHVDIRAPRVLFRDRAGGEDLPADLAVRHARAEGQVVMLWGSRSLSTPQVEASQAPRNYRLLAPVRGKAEQGTFTSGAGYGTPRHWQFDGPILVQLVQGGVLRGQRLVWEGNTWILDGQVTYQRLEQTFSGPKAIRTPEGVQFPAGLAGRMPSAQGPLDLKAGRCREAGNRVYLEGGVTCTGNGWVLTAEQVVLILGPNREVTRVEATRQVRLTGSMGEGRGRQLGLDLPARRAEWDGKVRGTAEMQP